jgi:cell filamentation protein
MPNYELSNDTLKNKFGIVRYKVLEAKSRGLVLIRAAQIEAGRGAKGNLDEAHLRAIHKHLFQDVFEWAGRTRDEQVKLSDGTVASMPTMAKQGSPDAFMKGPLIAPALMGLFQRLRDDGNYKGFSDQVFVEKAASFLGRLNSIHPFREGNGRTQRMFMSELAKESGRDLDFGGITQARNTEASIDAHAMKDLKPMQSLIRDAMVPERVALLKNVIADFAAKLGPAAVGNSNFTIAEPGQVIRAAVFTVKIGEHFVFRDVAKGEMKIAHVKDMPRADMKTGEKFAVEVKTEPTQAAPQKTAQPQQAPAKQQAVVRVVRSKAQDQDRGR